MKLRTNLKRLTVLLAVIIIMVNLIQFFMPTFATNNSKSLKFDKISNPNSGVGDADGVENGGDRETSYAWALATRGNYVYVGTNKNIIGDAAAGQFVESMVKAGASEDMAWNIINAATDGEIPKPTTTEGGEILKCDITTGEITKIFTADADVAFRMAIEFEGDLYFGSYSKDTTADNYIYKVDESDKITVAFTSKAGTSMRAACIYDNQLYFGGVDAREQLSEGDKECVKLAIMKKDANDDTKWERVADYKDFYEYANDSAIKNQITSPIWDICSYDGYIYATIPNSLGIVMYKGHPAEGNETANEYGWNWTEIIGKNSKVNNIGLADTAEGHIGDFAGLITMAATPFVFNNELYLMNFDNTILATVQALAGRLLAITNKNNEDININQYLKPMYTTLNTPQKLWKYDKATGKFNEVESFAKFMKGTCNEYLWRTEVYNNELYITTMDSAVLYNWVIKLTGDDFTTLTEENLDSASTKINDFVELVSPYASLNEEISEMIDLLKETATILTEYKAVMKDGKAFNEFVKKYEEIFIKLEKLKDTLKDMDKTGISMIDTALDDLLEIHSKIDISGLKMYAYIVRMVENDTWGFDIIKTSDGKNFEVVTDNGFGDKYNYGGRSLIATKAGLYVGTANPFYGAQLWRVSESTTNNKEEPKPDDNKNQNTGVTEQEINELKDKINSLIGNQEKFEEELKKIGAEIASLKANNSSGKTDSDNTVAKNKLPNAGNPYMIVTLITVAGVGALATFKHLQYRNIDKH